MERSSSLFCVCRCVHFLSLFLFDFFPFLPHLRSLLSEAVLLVWLFFLLSSSTSPSGPLGSSAPSLSRSFPSFSRSSECKREEVLRMAQTHMGVGRPLEGSSGGISPSATLETRVRLRRTQTGSRARVWCMPIHLGQISFQSSPGYPSTLRDADSQALRPLSLSIHTHAYTISPC